MLIIGHRGARGLAPENTLASFEAALKQNVDMIEFDIRVTKDLIPVLNHSRSIKIDGKVFGKISEHTYDELRKAKFDLLSLDEALKKVGSDVPFYIEVKGGEPVDPIITVLKKVLGRNLKPNDILLASKNQKTLKSLHTALPELATIIIEPFSGIRAMRRAKELGTKNLSMNHWWLWSGFISSMHSRGYTLYAYTLNDPAKAERWAKHGLAGVVTDFPDRFRNL